MAYGLSNGHVTVKGQTRDPHTLRAQYLENYLSYRLQICYAALYREYLAGAQIIFPESGCGLGHATPTIFGSMVGYPSDSLASCIYFIVSVDLISSRLPCFTFFFFICFSGCVRARLSLADHSAFEFMIDRLYRIVSYRI